MKKICIPALIVIASSLLTGCGHDPKKVAATVVDLAADACVELARIHNNGLVETICATHDDVLPIVMDILSKKAGAAPVAAPAEDVVCVRQGNDRLCVARTELASRFDDIASRVNARLAAKGK